MSQTTCPVCGGSGGYPSTRRVHDPNGGMFREVPVRENCLNCGGTGFVNSRKNEKITPIGDPILGREGGSFEDIANALICIGIWAVASYYADVLMNFEWYWSLGLGLLSALIVFRLLAGPLRFVLFALKYIAIIFVIGLIAFYLF